MYFSILAHFCFHYAVLKCLMLAVRIYQNDKKDQNKKIVIWVFLVSWFNEFHKIKKKKNNHKKQPEFWLPGDTDLL